ncbi:MAG: tryptophan synthase subunit beta, partial [Woeseiaceae bacterium]|nr:tryptophan synthase subunit beta [Woeseiaceae bacterium]
MSFVLQADEARTLLDASLRGELPDERGRFGPFGGRYVPETLVPAFERLEQGVREHLHDDSFQQAYRRELREWVGRPTALTHAPRLSKRWGAEVWLKREDLA